MYIVHCTMQIVHNISLHSKGDEVFNRDIDPYQRFLMPMCPEWTLLTSSTNVHIGQRVLS